MRIGNARACYSAALTTASQTTLKVEACGTQKTTAVSLDVPPKDLAARERVPVYQANTQCARLQEILQEKQEEWSVDGPPTVFTGPGSPYTVSPTTPRATDTIGIMTSTHAADETATSTTRAGTASGAARGTASARRATSASCIPARSSASAWTSTNARILAFLRPLSPTVDRRPPAPTTTDPSPVHATVDTLPFKLASAAST